MGKLKCDPPYLIRMAIAFGLAPLALLLFTCSALGGTPTSSNTVPIILVWDKPSPPDATLVYRVYFGTNAAAATSNLLATITNPPSYNATSLCWTNYLLKPGPYFFTMTSSNLWGSSFFIDAVQTPPAPPLLLNLGVQPAL